MRQTTVGYIVTIKGFPMVLYPNPDARDSRLLYGSGKATVFNSRRAANRAIQRTRRIAAAAAPEDTWEIFDNLQVRLIRLIHH